MFEDFFTVYNMVEPPEYFDDEDLLEEYEEDDLLRNYDLLEDKLLNYSGITEPVFTLFSDTENQLNIDLGIKSNSVVKDYSNLDIEDLLRLEGITSVNNKPIRFGDKRIRTWGKSTSHHRRKDPVTGNASARDISIQGGTIKDYEDLKNILLNNENVRNWMASKNWGIINEVTPEILAASGSTGNHFHFGPDKWAVRTWKAWNNDPSVSITMSFKNQTFNDNKTFTRVLNDAYKKELIRNGIDPRFSTILTAQDALETGWGKTVHGNYNYGNMTTNGNDWHKQDKAGRKWKDFNSLEDYVKYKIQRLSNYKIFETFTPDSNIAVMMQTLANKGYDRGNHSYGKNVANTHKTVLKYV